MNDKYGFSPHAFSVYSNIPAFCRLLRFRSKKKIILHATFMRLYRL